MSKKDGPERLIVILAEIAATKKGKADVARRVRYLSEHYDVTILTSSAAACRSLFPEAKVVGIGSVRIRGGLLLFCVSCWFALCMMRTRLVYVAELSCSPAVIFTRCRRIVCYGNTHPMQHIMLTGRGIPLIKRPLELLSKLLLVSGLRKCDTILAISPMLAESYLALGVEKSRMKTVSVGVDLSLYRDHQAGPRKDRFIAVSHGTLSVERGLEKMIDAASVLAPKSPELVLRLVGATGDIEQKICELVKRSGSKANVEALPPVPNDQIPEILAQCHCGISLLEPSPYFEASPPVKIMEFLAAGLPVIANDLPSHTLYLENLANALIVDYSSESLASALEKMILDEELRMKLSSGAKQKALELSDKASLRELLIAFASRPE